MSAFSLDAITGKLVRLNQQNSGGNGPCHISVDATGKCLLVANYGSGSIAALPIQADSSLGKSGDDHSTHRFRRKSKTSGGATCTFHFTRRRIIVSRSIAILAWTKFSSIASMPRRQNSSPMIRRLRALRPGSGPRHFVFSADEKFVYVINEMGGTITVFSYAATNAAMTEVQTISTLPKDFNREQHYGRNCPASLWQVSLRFESRA
ncbi:MAG: beta-propeller fold lactonase family protein [Limisphaerales bacterium]